MSLSPAGQLQRFQHPQPPVPANISGPCATSRSQPRAQGFPLVTVLGSDSSFSLTLYMVSCGVLSSRGAQSCSHSSGRNEERRGEDGRTLVLSHTGLSGT